MKTLTYLGKLGELTLKGDNISLFEKQLVANARHCLQSVESEVFLRHGRLYIECPPESSPAVEYTLNHLAGINGWAQARVCEKDMSLIKKHALEAAKDAKEKGACSFKIEARRSDKSFALSSYEICKEAGAFVQENTDLKVDVHSPDAVISVEIREHCYIYCDFCEPSSADFSSAASFAAKTHKRQNGNRGLPALTSGKGLLLLSGGLDSPVAGYKMICRGLSIECVYFHAYPYTSEEAKQKAERLAQILSDYAVKTHLNIISFTEIQSRIKQKSPPAFFTLMLRLCMIKCADLLARRVKASCLITGESLGQVASQTLQNMSVTQRATDLLFLRPLAGSDKEEIISAARKIGTYETSSLPYEDCCTLFSPKHPVLNASEEESLAVYENLRADDLIKKAFDERLIKRFDSAGNIASLYGTKPNKDKLASYTDCLIKPL